MTTARGRELRIHFEVDAGTSCLAPLPPPTSTYFRVGRNAVQKGEFDLDDSTPSGPRAPEQVVLGSKSEPNTPLIYYYFPVVDMLSWLRWSAFRSRCRIRESLQVLTRKHPSTIRNSAAAQAGASLNAGRQQGEHHSLRCSNWCGAVAGSTEGGEGSWGRYQSFRRSLATFTEVL